MTVAELIETLRGLPQDHEIAVFGTLAQPRPPVVERANPWAHPRGEFTAQGFADPKRAFLIRPAREVV